MGGGETSSVAIGQDHGATEALLFVAVCLLIGVATRSYLKFIPLPYTVLLLVWGIWIGVGKATYADNWEHLSPGITTWENVNPEFLLSLFLPVLLFASAFALEWHTFRQVFWQAMLLAFPGACIGTALTAVLVKYLFPYDWTWSQYLLFGAMLSATDPVAVVALLKEVGVDKRLRVVVDGEALLNDGSAYVLFLLFQQFASGANLDAGDVISLLAQLSLGGPAWGLASGIGVVLVLRFIFNDEMSEITLTIAAAFACFIVGNAIFGVSGVLAIVVLGIYMSAHGGLYVSHSVAHSLHVVWEELEFVGNTVIFVLSGTIIADRIIESHQDNGITHITGRDYGYAVLLWLLLLLVRGVMFLLMYPLLKRTGYGITWKTFLVMIWAGLRGAVGLALALFVLFDSSLGTYEFRNLFFFLMGWVAALTILVQGSTMGLLLQLLGMTKTPTVKRNFIQHIVRRLENEGDKFLSANPQDPLLGEPRWDAVEQSCALTTDETLARAQPGLSRHIASAVEVSAASLYTRLTRNNARQEVAERFNRTLLVEEARHRFLCSLRSLYLEQYSKGHLGSHGLYRLLAVVDRKLDRPEQPLTMWKQLRSQIALQPWLLQTVSLLNMMRMPSQVICWIASKQIRTSIKVAAAVLSCQHEALRLAMEFDVGDQWQSDNMFFDRELDALLQLLRKNVVQQIQAESEADQKMALEYLGGIGEAFPQLMEDVQTHHVSLALLHKKASLVKQLARSGLLDDKEFDSLFSCVEVRMKRMELLPVSTPLPRLIDGLHSCAAFDGLTDVQLRSLRRRAAIVFLNPGDPLPVDKNSCFLLLQGAVQLHWGASQVSGRGAVRTGSKASTHSLQTPSSKALSKTTPAAPSCAKHSNSDGILTDRLPVCSNAQPASDGNSMDSSSAGVSTPAAGLHATTALTSMLELQPTNQAAMPQSDGQPNVGPDIQTDGTNRNNQEPDVDGHCVQAVLVSAGSGSAGRRGDGASETLTLRQTADDQQDSQSVRVSGCSCLLGLAPVVGNPLYSDAWGHADTVVMGVRLSVQALQALMAGHSSVITRVWQQYGAQATLGLDRNPWADAADWQQLLWQFHYAKVHHIPSKSQLPTDAQSLLVQGVVCNAQGRTIRAPAVLSSSQDTVTQEACVVLVVGNVHDSELPPIDRPSIAQSPEYASLKAQRMRARLTATNSSKKSKTLVKGWKAVSLGEGQAASQQVPEGPEVPLRPGMSSLPSDVGVERVRQGGGDATQRGGYTAAEPDAEANGRDNAAGGGLQRSVHWQRHTHT